MATIAQNLQSLVTAKNNIATAITEKGVVVPESSGFLNYSDLIQQIESMPSGDKYFLSPMYSYSEKYTRNLTNYQPICNVINNTISFTFLGASKYNKSGYNVSATGNIFIPLLKITGQNISVIKIADIATKKVKIKGIFNKINGVLNCAASSSYMSDADTFILNMLGNGESYSCSLLARYPAPSTDLNTDSMSFQYLTTVSGLGELGNVTYKRYEAPYLYDMSIMRDDIPFELNVNMSDINNLQNISDGILYFRFQESVSDLYAPRTDYSSTGAAGYVAPVNGLTYSLTITDIEITEQEE